MRHNPPPIFFTSPIGHRIPGGELLEGLLVVSCSFLAVLVGRESLHGGAEAGGGWSESLAGDDRTSDAEEGDGLSTSCNAQQRC